MEMKALILAQRILALLKQHRLSQAECVAVLSAALDVIPVEVSDQVAQEPGE